MGISLCVVRCNCRVGLCGTHPKEDILRMTCVMCYFQLSVHRSWFFFCCLHAIRGFDCGTEHHDHTLEQDLNSGSEEATT